MLKHKVSAPYTRLSFATEKGNLEIDQEMKNIISDDMDLDIISVETTRDVGGDDCATFSISLVYRDLWFSQINGNDFVKIEMGRGDKKETVLYGMIDNVFKSTSFIQLTPIRSITITGRGFNKAFMQFDIGAVQEIDMVYQNNGFYENQIAGLGQNSPAKLIEIAVSHYIDKGIDMEFANGKHRKDYVSTIYKEKAGDPDLSLGNINNSYQYQGSLWDYLKELTNAPFNEIFWEVIDDKPTFIVRPTPFNPEEWEGLGLTKIDDEEIIDDNTGKSDLETYTVYSVKGEGMATDYAMIMGAPIRYKPYYKRYGLRRLEVVSKYINSGGSGIGGGLTGTTSIPAGFGGQLGSPVPSGVSLTSPFGMRMHPIQNVMKMHEGIDLAGSYGTPIFAADSGIVSFVVYDSSGGHMLEIKHDSGLATQYLHLAEKPSVREGERITKGQQIGKMGSTGNSTGPHLHFEVHVNGAPVDPEPYLSITQQGGSSQGPLSAPRDYIKSVNYNKKVDTPEEIALKERKKQYDELKRAEAQTEADKLTEGNRKADSINSLLSDLGFTNRKLVKDYDKEDEANALINATNEEIANADRSDVSSTSQKTIDLFNRNIKNGYMQNGSIQVVGNGVYKVGSRLLINSTNVEYYIENVSHSFVYNEGWFTNLQVTRGLKYGTRFTRPWNAWSLITSSDLQEISGIDPSTAIINTSVMGMGAGGTGGFNPIAFSDPTGFRSRIGQIAKAHAGEIYSQDIRMNPGYSDCSSFVYKVAMEAHGRNWAGTWAEPTYTMHKTDLRYEIPLSQAQPRDILWRWGHTEFLGDDGRTYGAHAPGIVSGPGGQYNSNNWEKAYRLKGL